ncbi:RDD family protein [Rhodococcus sp. H36-A4]|uniref:RDD family protein n=1 Tax=Rhodococcus sp. H36-A4 TaxID=3004353 RepID=UPI0022AE71A5|nr:RDD family protein [Rhodococcus sp. H36-A4]MCZ4077680.1 RDD family protein [Rhodococcus sp. H36-A4]
MSHPQPSVEDMRPAGIVTRGVAAFIDLAVVGALMGSVYVGSLFVQLLFSPQSFNFRSPAVFLSISVFLALSIGYLTLCWATTGRTVGAILMGVRLVSPRHRVLRWPLAALRAVLCVVFAFGLLWAAVDGRRRSLQDIVLRTAVVYDWQPNAELVDPHATTGQ